MSDESDAWLEAGTPLADRVSPGLPLTRTITDAVVEVLTSAGFWSGLALCILAGRASLGG